MRYFSKIDDLIVLGVLGAIKVSKNLFARFQNTTLLALRYKFDKKGKVRENHSTSTPVWIERLTRDRSFVMRTCLVLFKFGFRGFLGFLALSPNITIFFRFYRFFRFFSFISVFPNFFMFFRFYRFFSFIYEPIIFFGFRF